MLLCWTVRPAIEGLLEAFMMPARVTRWNNSKALHIAAQVEGLDQ